MMTMTLRTKIMRLAVALPLAATLAGCTRDHQFQPVDMWNTTRLKPYESVETPAGTTALPMPIGVVARGQLRADDALYTGKANGRLVTEFPYRIDEKVLKRGQERYMVYCSPCHGAMGDGKGIVVTRGFSPPPDYTEDRLVQAPVGHIYDVITNGYGAMYSYAARVPVNDRWAITAYIRVLQNARKNAKNGVPVDKNQLIDGGGVYSPDLVPTKLEGHEAGGGHEAAEAAGHETPEGAAPGSSIPNKARPDEDAEAKHGTEGGH